MSRTLIHGSKYHKLGGLVFYMSLQMGVGTLGLVEYLDNHYTPLYDKYYPQMNLPETIRLLKQHTGHQERENLKETSDIRSDVINQDLSEDLMLNVIHKNLEAIGIDPIYKGKGSEELK